MNEDEGNNQRMMLAALLCLVVLMIWPFLFPPVKKPASAEDAKEKDTTADNGELPLAREKVETSTLTGSLAPATVVPEQSFAFSGVVHSEGKELPFEVKLSNVGGAFTEFNLLAYHERDANNRPTDTSVSLSNDWSEAPSSRLAFGQMAGVGFGEETTFQFPERPVYEIVSEKDGYIKYRLATPEGIVVEREYRFASDSFAVEMAVSVRNESSRQHEHRLWISSGLEINDATKPPSGFFNFAAPAADHLESLCFSDGSVYRHRVGSGKPSKTLAENVGWVGIDRQYFLAAVLARDGSRDEAECTLEENFSIARSKLSMPVVSMAPGEVHRHKFTAYLGVKVPTLLEAVDSDLTSSINYKFFGLNLAPLCEALLWVLRWLHTLTNSWGFAIIGLTILVKIVLFPLNQRQGKSMRALSALKPEMDRIREKFADDKQRQSEEMMRLYREHNVSPVGGCLPVLLQAPIGLAFYRALASSVDLYQEDFLWISDLTTRDSYFILPVCLVVVMFLQQRMMPTAMDPAQQKIMTYTMPVIFGSIMMALPAGLCVYIFVNTLLTIVQQQLINRSIGPPPGAQSSSIVQGATS
ncbi:MAG: membrane protein insertase YidC [Myxococcales bacterium]|nr:membrane protein insertase YidC [Myxococcales bacterium]